MNHDPLAQAVDQYVEELTLGMEPDERAALARLERAQGDEFKECVKAANWIEHAVVRASQERLTSSGMTQVVAVGADSPSVEALGKELGDFEIVREVGRGGMGVVFEARQKSLDRRVALKVLPPGVSWGETATARFTREARVAGRLQHPNIVPVYAFGEDEGVCYFAMQFIDGVPLSHLAKVRQAELARGASHGPAGDPKRDGTRLGTPAGMPATPKGGALTWPARLPKPSQPEYYRAIGTLMAQVSRAVQYAHERGVLHRDIKPSNLILDNRGSVWIADFGLARLVDDASVTRSGQLLGTLCYMSPEQAAASGQVDERTDIYGLGATLYELLALRPPFAAMKTGALLRAIQESEPERPSWQNAAVPSMLESIALKAMAKSPASRYGTARELADDLERFLSPSGQESARRHPPPRRYHGWAISAGFAAATLLTLAVVAFLALRSGFRGRESVVPVAAAVDPVTRLVEAGRHAYEVEDLETARSRFDEAAGLRSDSILPHVYLGLLALREETDEGKNRARLAFQNAVSLAPDSQLLWALRFLAGSGERLDWRHLREKLQSVQDDPCAEKFAPDGLYVLGRAAEFRDPGWAVNLMGLALMCRPTFTEAQAFRGRLRHRVGQLEEALKDLSSACESEPRRAVYRVWRGWVLEELGRGEQARADFDRAVELDPAIPTLKERFLWMKKRLPEMLSASNPLGQPSFVPHPELQPEYRAIASMTPYGFADYFALGQVHAAMGNAYQAKNAFEQAVNSLPAGKIGFSAAAAYLELAKILGDDYGRDADAERGYLEAVDACPSMEFYLELCDFYGRRNRWSKALGALDDAVTDHGLLPDARFRAARAKAYKNLGQPELARRELMEALSELDRGGQARLNRQELERQLQELGSPPVSEQ